MFRSTTRPALGLGPACAVALLTTAQAQAGITMDWVTVGNAGNAPNPIVMNDGTTGYGSVGYEYRIGTYEVTNSQYAAFLNAVASSDPNGLYNTNMGSNPRGGIRRANVGGVFTYTVKPAMGDKPVNYVSWYDAARFSNWMTNGQGAGGTESGVYTFDGVDSISGITRDLSNPDQVFLPTEDEWRKAAFHQPAAQGGDSTDYWLYATQSNSVPTIATATITGDVANPGANVVNYNFGADWNGQDGNLTTVGSAGNTSFYGAYDMNGNVSEWNETPINSFRAANGGSFDGKFDLFLRSSFRNFTTPTLEFSARGFRLASPVPGPGAVTLLGLGGLLAARRRRG